MRGCLPSARCSLPAAPCLLQSRPAQPLAGTTRAGGRKGGEGGRGGLGQAGMGRVGRREWGSRRAWEQVGGGRGYRALWEGQKEVGTSGAKGGVKAGGTGRGW